ncbi:leucine export protein LeuE [Citrobacter koseri]|nr:leucine export protein LeuE [Citrobacter koseri]
MATLITQCEEIFSLIKIVGGAYLLWFAWNSIRHQATPQMPTLQQPISAPWSVFFRRGLLTDLSNPQTVLFFISIFSVTLSAETPDMGKTDGLGRHRALFRHLAHLPEPGLFPTGGTPRLRADSAHCQQGDWRDHRRVRPQADLRRREPPLASSRAAT